MSYEKYIRPYSSRPGTWVFRYGKIKKFFHSKEDAILARDFHLSTITQKGPGSLFASGELREYREAKALAGDVPLSQIVREWLSLTRPFKKAPNVSAALDLWLGRCERKKLSERTLETYRISAKRIEAAFSKNTLAELNERRLLDWYYEMPGAARSRRGILTNALSWLNFCAESGWIEKAPTIRRHQLERELSSGVGVFSVREVEKILDTVLDRFPEYFPNMALRAYVGLRTVEASKMRWEWIDFARKRITVPAEICKTRDTWTLQAPNLPEKIFRCLAPYAKTSGAIPSPENDAWERLLAALPVPWKHNGLRHTFCTMHISLCGDASRTATLLKHRGLSMLYKHYCGSLVSQCEAERYFA